MALFTTTNYPVNALIEDVDLGKIGLPELQRPFVWPNVTVRNLLDSLYRGYPAGFLLFWETGADAGLRGISTRNNQAVPKLAIVDGQQRLTSLYAVIKGAEITRANFRKERIRIAFNPLSERFDVADAAIAKDKSYIPDISTIWRPSTSLLSLARTFISELAKVRTLTKEEQDRIEDAISRLHALPHYQFTALTLSGNVDAQTVGDVFVRINGEGRKLNQSDFVMTLMSVFWDHGRHELEEFAGNSAQPSNGKASPFNHFIKPGPDQMLRATVGVALKRAKFANVYSILRGKDAQTGMDDPSRRTWQFTRMQEAQKHVLNLANWHHFLSALSLAGYRGEKMITSQLAIIFSYVIYLIGLTEYRIDKARIRQAIAEFFFMAALTSRYTASSESKFEADLSMVSGLRNGEAFLAKLREISATALPDDYWTVTLPSQLATSAARSPSLCAYHASLIRLDANVLYSPLKIATLLDPAVKGPKAAFRPLHLFPRAYLEKMGITNTKEINQIANFAPVEWPEHITSGKKAPSEFVPPLDKKLSAAEREQMYGWHALPHLWWELPYEEFLKQRRTRMAGVIKQAWEQLAGKEPPRSEGGAIVVADLISAGESEAVEFKSTLRRNLHSGHDDDKIQMAVLKTIAGFLNAKGGTLLIGVADDGKAIGLESDGFENEDKMGLHLANLIDERLGKLFRPYIHPHFEDHDGGRVLAVRCEKGPKAAFVKDKNELRFFVRGGNATAELSGAALADYVNHRFR